MTLASQKRTERFYVEDAAKRLNRQWHVGADRERPDFIVSDDSETFGLEVCEVFTGQQDSGGAEMKKEESQNQKIVDTLRREFNATDDTPLIVKLLGDMCPENLAAVVPALRTLELSEKQPTYHQVIDIDEGEARLRVHVTVSLRPNWFYVGDRVGWVDKNPMGRITEAVERKAKKLSEYRAALGLNDVRLLIVANRIMNSGKLMLPTAANVDLRGFTKVYFLSYPESVHIFG